ncbi:hypothetical protein HBH44_026430 [Parastagonospora nodorum]|nr:hypothetical protein HBH54_088410 [Parastagonospora nodorum]KAH4171803.1 hypothetical protein HBH44_026430 [Parastagonospora nodorum]KAH4616625.1 hypothetical protein HBH55_203230 [Parastagonospora nodorum]KAH4646202.1 hypothetical protein HBH81_038260 [Parastagonospora nodorum]
MALPPIKRSQTYEPRRYASSNKGTPVILLSQLLTNNRTTLYSTPLEAWKIAPLLVCSSIATTPCRKVIAAYALNYLELRFLSANIMALVGTVLYNAIKEYYDDRMRKTIYFYSYTVENNYNAICEKWKRLSEICYYNCAGKREDNILTVDECRTSYSNKKDIEANEREEETRVQLRELLGEIYDILLREFRRADDFTESVTHNDDEQELELEDCDALVERYEEEINCSNLYSTV